MSTVLSNHLTPDMPLAALVNSLLPEPEALCLDHLEQTDQDLRLHLHTTAADGCCPRCHHASHRVHSRYQRTVADTNWGSYTVSLHLTVRRFRCPNPACDQTAFAERMPQVAPIAARRTTRLVQQHTRLARALGGAAGARQAAQCGISTSRQTLLRTLRQQILAPPAKPRIIGLDDWAQGNGQPMGTIIVDLERRQPLALLPDDREDTVAAWLAEYPTLEIVCRDRAQVSANAVQRGAPQAQQVDCWHVLKNVGEVVQRVTDRPRPARDTAANPPPERPSPCETTSPPDPDSATPAMDNPDDAVPNDTPQRQTNRATQWTHVQQLHQAGQSQRAIARELGLHRRTVKKYLLADQSPAPSQRRPSSPSSIWPYADHVRRRTQDGGTMRTIWRELQQQGYGGSYRAVRRFVQRHPTPSAANETQSRRRRHLSARQTRSLLLTPADALHHDTLALRERLEAGCADLADTGARARDLLRIIRQQDAPALEP